MGTLGQQKMRNSISRIPLRGLYWTRTSDPIDVNDVLYQLSQQTVLIAFPTEFYILGRILDVLLIYLSLFAMRANFEKFGEELRSVV